MEKTKYSKRILSRKEFLKESGYPAAWLDRVLHCWFADEFCFRTSDAPNAKFMIDTEAFEHYRRMGELK